MKKKKIVIFSIVIVILFLVISLLRNDNKTVLINEKKEDYLINSNAITMMYETETGSGEYQITNDTSWPQEGYIFNERLSGCENGGTLSWNSETNRVIMMSNTSDRCYVYFDKYSSVQITNVVASNITSNSITINVSATSGTNQISKYYYSINNGSSYTESTNNIYIFTGLEEGTKYSIKVYAVDTKNYSSNVYSLNIATKTGPTLVDYIINEVYVSDGVNGLYYHDGVGTYTNADQEAGDNSYRYSGANPNNYVCFGSDAETCPDEYLYRIIGVFDEDSDEEYNVKLIRNSVYKRNSWALDNVTIWENSLLNSELNDNFINTFSSNWQSKISNYDWYFGSVADPGYNVKNFFDFEHFVNDFSNKIIYANKIALMYPSDYGYASDYSLSWGDSMYNYDEINFKSNNWLFLGLDEWTLTSGSNGTSDLVYYVTTYGRLSYEEGPSNFYFRPTFYLNANVIYIGGSGTESDPYRIS